MSSLEELQSLQSLVGVCRPAFANWDAAPIAICRGSNGYRGNSTCGKELYWKAPNSTNDFSPTPKEAPDERDYVPVYDDP